MFGTTGGNPMQGDAGLPARSGAEGDPVNRIDPHGLLSLDISGEVCFYLCVGGGRGKDGDGNSSWFVTFGAGTPGASASLGGSGGDVSQGWAGEWSCGVGPASITG
ncbi:hypothetical protein, partial [Streptomyces sp. WAC04114]|uniref:hypothetical protein n=1 Tax=Streptomyces sp. WAC04114 TaxID=2867961 RepID=UPI001C8C2210